MREFGSVWAHCATVTLFHMKTRIAWGRCETRPSALPLPTRSSSLLGIHIFTHKQTLQRSRRPNGFFFSGPRELWNSVKHSVNFQFSDWWVTMGERKRGSRECEEFRDCIFSFSVKCKLSRPLMIQTLSFQSFVLSLSFSLYPRWVEHSELLELFHFLHSRSLARPFLLGLLS